jgi:hypothetical protein
MELDTSGEKVPKSPADDHEPPSSPAAASLEAGLSLGEAESLSGQEGEPWRSPDLDGQASRGGEAGR